MNKRLTVHMDEKPIYDIVISENYDLLAGEMEKLGCKTRRVCIVTDSNVARYHLDAVKEALAPVCRELHVHVIPAGEENKTLARIQKIYETLILAKFDRKDLLVALGGGVTGDMTGFAAATYLRGIDFVQMPTTLLSQVDSSIGGKTGVDFDSYKNMVGAFKMPKLVYMNLNVLKTMDREAYLSGMGEIIKHGLIKDAGYLDLIYRNMEGIRACDPSALMPIIEGSCRIKRDVVEKDPTEKGDRALLNFGHTLGHAIEKLKDFSLYHGSCVALGCVAASYISMKRGSITEAEFGKIRETFAGCGLPVEECELSAGDVILATKNDKKMEAGVIKFVLLESVGHAYVDRTVTEEEMREALIAIGLRG